jgi:hypothetical protein
LWWSMEKSSPHASLSSSGTTSVRTSSDDRMDHLSRAASARCLRPGDKTAF